MSTAAHGARAFSPEAFAELVSALRAQGYEARSFADVDPSARHLVLRHDVDFSLDAAHAMAEMESALGVTATFFVLLRTEFYNPMSAAGQEALRRIIDHGHAVGLHFDAALYPGDRDSLAQAVEHECRLLEAIIDRPVTVMSFHRPASERLGESDSWAGRVNAYGPRYFREIGYCSDSRGAWHHGSPLDHPAVRGGRALQLLIHPFWWMPPIQPPAKKLRHFLGVRSALLDRELAHHCDVHKPQNA